jgi:rSAM/selenodomain-associated transferase 2
MSSQKVINAPLDSAITPFRKKLNSTLTKKPISVLQINLGKRCNLACTHCHVEASPKRTEELSPKVCHQLIKLIHRFPQIQIVDLTGGAPEMLYGFEPIVEAARTKGKQVVVVLWFEVRNCELVTLTETATERISIIIPVLNEVGTIEKVLASTQTSTNVEAIVVDGGSVDGTLELAQTLGVKVLSAPTGRAGQMNVGALAATGEILLFLHADTLLPPRFDTMVRTALKLPKQGNRKAAVAGAFALQIDAPLRSLRLIEWGVNWRSRCLQMPYGDQAIFLKAEIFHQMGGFAQLPIMEDFELVRRLRSMGHIALIPIPVVTSARRWLKKGIIQTTLINQIIILAYLLGVSPKQLVCWYRCQPKSTRKI